MAAWKFTPAFSLKKKNKKKKHILSSCKQTNKQLYIGVQDKVYKSSKNIFLSIMYIKFAICKHIQSWKSNQGPCQSFGSLS